MKKINLLLYILWVVLPNIALAFDPGPIPNAVPYLTINDLIDSLFHILWPITVAFFIIMFLFVSFTFVASQGDPEKVAKARNFFIYGIVGVVIALLAFSLPSMIRNTLGNGI